MSKVSLHMAKQIVDIAYPSSDFEASFRNTKINHIRKTFTIEQVEAWRREYFELQNRIRSMC